MWKEILNNSGILALIGVFIGFFLSEITNIFKKNKERKDSKSSLLDEVRFNHEQTKNKIDILKQAIAALEEQRFLSTKCAKYSTYEFEHLYHIALPKLSVLERDNLRHLNSYYREIDNILDGFDQSFKNDIDNARIGKNTFGSVYKAAETQLKDVRDSLEKSLEISSNLLKGKPLAIFKSKQA